MVFNRDLYFEIYKKRREYAERYCFPLRIFLGKNGLIENHELKGRIFINKEGEEFSVDNVYVHYYEGGYYYLALARNKHDSHIQITWNINCPLIWIENIHNYRLLL